MRDRLESEELRDKVAKCMSEIHSYMLNECRQISWTGSNPEREIKITQTKMVEKKFQPKETVPKTISISMPNWPYSRNILQELIKLETFLLNSFINLIYTEKFLFSDKSIQPNSKSLRFIFFLDQTPI